MFNFFLKSSRPSTQVLLEIVCTLRVQNFCVIKANIDWLDVPPNIGLSYNTQSVNGGDEGCLILKGTED
jgi:hypothetical protein